MPICVRGAVFLRHSVYSSSSQRRESVMGGTERWRQLPAGAAANLQKRKCANFFHTTIALTSYHAREATQNSLAKNNSRTHVLTWR